MPTIDPLMSMLSGVVSGWQQPGPITPDISVNGSFTVNGTGNSTIRSTSSTIGFNTSGSHSFYPSMTLPNVVIQDSPVRFDSVTIHQTPRENSMSVTGRGLYIVYIVDPKEDEILVDGQTVIANSPENARVKVFKKMKDDLNYDDLDVYVGKLLAIRNKKDFDSSTE